MSDSVRPHRRQPTRLPRPWDSPGKNTGVGCRFLLQCMKVKSENGQRAHEKMLNISKRNADQNYNELSPHTSQNGRHQKNLQTILGGKVWRKGNPPTLLVGM